MLLPLCVQLKVSVYAAGAADASQATLTVAAAAPCNTLKLPLVTRNGADEVQVPVKVVVASPALLSISIDVVGFVPPCKI